MSQENKDKADAAEITALGRRSLVIPASIAEEAEVKAMVDRIVKEWGGIDILVNNTGATSALLIEDMEKAEWDRVLSINLDGAFNCCQAVIPSLKQRGGGRIINIISYSGARMTMLGGVHYTSSKAGIWGLTRQLSFELGHYQITVNGISPGNIITPMLKSNTTPKRLEEMRKWYPLQDMPTPEDVANAAVFLASSKARMINGINLEVDGGVTIPIAIGVDWETYTRVKKETTTRRKKKRK
ncbi:MAG: SDR family NAD(P)-dependent oxidoreductase [Dehalococcoidales bacterium]|nr:SDR family NAD(P)-dependent oxidoreductase [Dehalococcoidales bacterium]MDP6576560.1 SDR family NAD(P)-dependent oxidoreductase [Dehalococcoidales bacterium]MDP7285713.1 SDR family NAD(P)-dependent oxidoreductase [Dehalococcoidales bacterium]MDP7415702.1 SDR family NAD(P)-dependent oxidoreductase [Dehalococcoidales bacterium]